MKSVMILALVLCMVTVTAIPAAQLGQPAFTHGVASGDVTSTAAILWTRVDRQASVKVEVWDNPFLTGPKVFQATEPQASSASDFTVKVDAIGLQPDTNYYYRFRHGDDGLKATIADAYRLFAGCPRRPKQLPEFLFRPV